VCFIGSFGFSVEASATRLPGTVELSPTPLDHSLDASMLTVLGLNANVLATGSLAFEGGYDPRNWSGILRAVSLNIDGTLSRVVWDAGAILADASATSPGRRTILTASADSTGAVTGMAFEPNSRFDASETEGLMTPMPHDAVNDTLAARVDYLRGIRSEETAGVMRTRQTLLGAIVDAQTVYVAYPTGNYTNAWPTTIRGVSVPAPELAPDAQGYDTFVAANANRPPTVYVGANDGMLHAFNAPVPDCTTFDSSGNCSHYMAGVDAGKELWAYVPRATYKHLGNLTSLHDFQWAPTVDATPVTRDVYFSERGDHTWHTVLVGGLRLGGRGIYALDITHPTAASEVFPERTVLWEFDADAAPGTSASGGAYDPADLGFTYGQPAIARLANGRWAVLIPSGYFADCSQPDKPINCEAATGTPPTDYSALFVLDAQTGEVIAELKTPTDIEGVTSCGLSSPVLGAYSNDQIDDVAFAGDLAGNLWRFDLSAPNPLNWKVTLAYRPTVQGVQPITTMPRLFPDPTTHRFMVVFGTGKYLGEGDNTTASVPTQSVYGIRDRVDHNGKSITAARSGLQVQTLTQTVVTDPSDPNADTTLRNLSSHPVSSKADGWYFDLDVTVGERVVVTPSALFNTNTVLVSTLIPSDDAAHVATGGVVMAVDALTGGPGSTVWSFGGIAYAGAVINQAPSAHMLPVATIMGGGKLLLPGVSLKGKKVDLDLPLSFGSPLWRRRSWSVLTQGP
jgi:type IV pilus assembly protein PilY1